MLRIPHLILVFLIQGVPYWFVLRPALLKTGGIPQLTEHGFLLISGATIFTILAGNILNNYYDRINDAMNRPSQALGGRILTPTFALFLYGLLVACAHWMAFQLDRTLRPTDHWPLWVFPGISFMLFLHAWVFKCTAVVGNLLISFLWALAPLLMLLPEQRAIWLSSFVAPETIHQAVGLVWLYALFNFLTNFLGEQINDLQDFPGDAACGCNTLAVLKGPRFAKKPAGITGLALSLFISLLLLFWRETKAPDWQVIAGILFLLVPSVIATILVYLAKGKPGYSKAGILLRIVLFSGIFLLSRHWPEDIVGAAKSFLASWQANIM